MTSETRTVLITGCSSGIGAALAQAFHRQGWRVLASARRVEALGALAGAGVETLALDVTDAASIAACAERLREQGTRLNLLVNNAGYGQFGAVIDLSSDDLRRQFETNVVAPVALTRALLPALRHGGWACVANIGSISGIVTTPFAGAYCASKAALHALSDALRMELAPLGVRVVTVQPGGIASGFGDAAQAAVRLPADSPYAPIAADVRARTQASQQGATPAELFADGVARHLGQADPAPVYRAGTQSTAGPLARRLLPTRLLDRLLSRRFGLARL